MTSVASPKTKTHHFYKHIQNQLSKESICTIVFIILLGVLYSLSSFYGSIDDIPKTNNMTVINYMFIIYMIYISYIFTHVCT